MAEQTILIAEDNPDIRDGVLDDVTNLISTAASLASYLLKIGANSTTGVVSSVLDYLSSGANYVCYVNGEQTTYKTSVVSCAGGRHLGAQDCFRQCGHYGSAAPGHGGSAGGGLGAERLHPL